MFDWNIVQNNLIYGYEGKNYLTQGTNLASNLFLYTIVLLAELVRQICNMDWLKNLKAHI
jgi:hypothetical protein